MAQTPKTLWNSTTWEGPEINSLQSYLEELRFLKRYRFFLYASSFYIPLCWNGIGEEDCSEHWQLDESFTVPSYSIYWQSASTSLWKPSEVLYYELGKPLSLLGSGTIVSLNRMGMRESLAQEVQDAELESLTHNAELRAGILKALGLSEFPHSRREWRDGKGRPFKWENENVRSAGSKQGKRRIDSSKR